MAKRFGMAHIIKQLIGRGLIHPPDWLSDNIQLLVVMGSFAYGCSQEISDFDVYGWAIPPKNQIFFHLSGEIEGFGRQKKRFNQWQQHHVWDAEALGGKGREYDFSIYNIVRYFQLAMEGNPNLVDSLFVPVDCVLHSTAVGELVRENRRLFLHKGCWPKMKGYSYSQLHKMNIKEHKGLEAVEAFEKAHKIDKNVTFKRVNKLYEKRSVGHKDDDLDHLNEAEFEEYYQLYSYMMKTAKRGELVKRFKFDVKFGSHTVRLLSQCEQILAEGDLDLRRNSEHLKAIRCGEVSEQEIRDFFTRKEKDLEKLYADSKLPWGPDEDKIKTLLLNCLEAHYGSLDNCIVTEDAAVRALREIAEVVDRNRKVLGG